MPWLANFRSAASSFASGVLPAAADYVRGALPRKRRREPDSESMDQPASKKTAAASMSRGDAPASSALPQPSCGTAQPGPRPGILSARPPSHLSRKLERQQQQLEQQQSARSAARVPLAIGGARPMLPPLQRPQQHYQRQQQLMEGRLGVQSPPPAELGAPQRRSSSQSPLARLAAPDQLATGIGAGQQQPLGAAGVAAAAAARTGPLNLQFQLDGAAQRTPARFGAAAGDGGLAQGDSSPPTTAVQMRRSTITRTPVRVKVWSMDLCLRRSLYRCMVARGAGAHLSHSLTERSRESVGDEGRNCWRLLYLLACRGPTR